MVNHNQTAPAVQLTRVSKTYKQGKTEVPALVDVSLNIPVGRFIAVMGPSGSGKSTLLHIIGGLTTPSSGEVWINGVSIAHYRDDQLTRFRRKQIGFIFQAYNLLPTMNALENVALPLIIDGTNINKARPEVEKILAALGLEERMHHRPDELSGGQQQRVALARALIAKAPLMLADEPTGNLDSKTGEAVLHLLRKITQGGKRTVIMVTHDAKAAAYADHVITLKDGQIVDQLVAMPG